MIRKCCQQTTPRYCSIDQLPHGLYGAIGTLHRTEQNRTYRSRDIMRDRFLKVKDSSGYRHLQSQSKPYSYTARSVLTDYATLHKTQVHKPFTTWVPKGIKLRNPAGNNCGPATEAP